MRPGLIIIVLSICCCFYTAANAQTGQSVTPIVLTGAFFKNTNLIQQFGNTYKATDVVGFVYAPGQPGHWAQVPVQVDERDTIDAGRIYNTATYVDPWSKALYGSNANYSSFKTIQYCDTNTFAGPDHDLTFDNDDELAFMARDLGTDEAPATVKAPVGVDTTTGVEVKMTGPDGHTGYLYLFNRANNNISPSAGKAYINGYVSSFTQKGVSYSFSGYKSKYNISFGPNPERSYVSTPYYVRGFADRWIDSVLVITEGNSKFINLYDRHAAGTDPTICIRSEYTFSGEDAVNKPSASCNPDSPPQAEGAFVTNKVGPIRVIRSVMGANSGPLTQRTHIFYDQVEIMIDYCRVHYIGGFCDFYDYNKAAGIMYYNSNNNNPATQPGFALQKGMKGIVIDGVPDPQWKSGQLVWEMVNSSYGTIFRYDTIATNIPAYNAGITSGPAIYQDSYYLDNVNAQAQGICQCTGDAAAWGTTGNIITAAPPTSATTELPYTDPRYAGKYYNITGRQANIYLPAASPQADSSNWITVGKYLNNQPSPVVSNWPRAYQDYSPVPVVNVYPNPTTGIVNVEATGTKNEKITATFYNSSGEKIYSCTANGYLIQAVDLHAQSAGFYIVRVAIGTKVIAKKILVNK